LASKFLVWHFVAFLGEFGLEDIRLALMFFGFILAFSTPRYRSTTIEVHDRMCAAAYAHLPLPITIRSQFVSFV